METTTDEAPTGLDIQAASAQIGADLFPPSQDSPPDGGKEEGAVEAPLAAETAPPSPTPTVRSVPKSWAKEYHEHWTKVDPKVQEYIEKREKDFLDGLEQYKGESSYAKSIREALTPYKQTLAGLNVDELQAIKALFQADHQLRYSPAEQKAHYFKTLAQNYGIDLAGVTASAPAQPVDPAIQSIQQEMQQLKQAEQARVQASQQEALTKAQKEVEAFASDEKAHPYYNEVFNEMALLVRANHTLSLQEAYDQAVRLNPVTYAKEVARIQTETEAKLKENARLEALPKKKALAANVKPRDTQRSPTEPLGTMDDALRSTLATIRARTS